MKNNFYTKNAIPLVTIGLPVLNGEKHLSRAIESLLSQSFKDFELIISDNSSTDSTSTICEDFMKNDDRIRYIKQPHTINIYSNFSFVLRQSKSKYFMWASHDDLWGNDFLKHAMNEFSKNTENIVAVFVPARYTINNAQQEYFIEGQSFKSFLSDSSEERIAHMLKNNFGNLFYSLFRRDALLINDKSALEVLTKYSLSEIPNLIYVAYHGNWRVLEAPLLYKETSIKTFAGAKWEQHGGFLHTESFSAYVSNILYSTYYHFLAAIDICGALNRMNLNAVSKIRLSILALWCLFSHFTTLLVRYKSKQ